MNNIFGSKNKKTPFSVGIVGGGQLAQMLSQAAKLREVQVVIQTPSINDPAALVSNRLVLTKPGDIKGLHELAACCHAITFENEWLDMNALIKLESLGANFIPSLSAIKPFVDKTSQRKLLDDLSIPGASWIPLSSNQIGPFKIPDGWNFPLMAKASRGGYDGKGTIALKDFTDLQNLLRSVNADNWFVERWIGFEKELALVASRDIDGNIRAYPLVETSQSNQICDWVMAPANVPHDVQQFAYNIAASLLTETHYIGVIAIEFFYGKNGLMVNEIAPRTHNSGHYTIEACNSSQFDQQICIAAGLAVPDPQLIAPGALMVNLLGLAEKNTLSLDHRLAELNKIEGLNLHWYGKEKETKGRKLGHATYLLSSTNPITRQREAQSALERIRSIWPTSLAIMD